MENFAKPAAVARFVLALLLGLGLDLWSKAYAWKTLVQSVVHRPDGAVLVFSHESEFVPNWLHFRATANRGAVFGLGQGQRPVFLVVSAAAVVFLGYLFATSGNQRLYQVVLGLLLAGVLGNMYDRVAFGYVRDMVYMLPGWRWPGSTREVFPWIYNVADAMLCVGVALMIVYSILAGRGKPQPAAGNAKG